MAIRNTSEQEITTEEQCYLVTFQEFGSISRFPHISGVSAPLYARKSTILFPFYHTSFPLYYDMRDIRHIMRDEEKEIIMMICNFGAHNTLAFSLSRLSSDERNMITTL